MPPEGPSFRELVFSDFLRYRPGARDASWLQLLLRCAALPGLIASIIVRAQQCAFRAGHPQLANLLRVVGVTVSGVDVTAGAQIGRGLYIPHPVGIVIGHRVVIGDDVTLAKGVVLGARNARTDAGATFPTIGDGATLYSNAVVVGGVHVGRGAQVGANSLVTGDVADNALVVGVPAVEVPRRQKAAASEG